MNKFVSITQKLALSLIAIAFSALALNAQQTVKGTVTDANGEPLIGAGAFVKGDTSHGTVTDIDGNYTLTDVDGSDVLVFSFMGYVTQEIPVNNRTVVNATLEEDNQYLDELVVVGYAVGNKRSVSGTVDRVQAEDMNSGLISSPIDAIRGKVPGLVISNAGGDISSTPTVRLRGTTSLSGGSDPLVIIDGVFTDISSLTDLSAQDIAEISVLKDASETAQYGSRGAAGVIVVQTMRGEEGRASVTYNGQFGVSQRYGRIETLSAEEYRHYGAGSLSSDLGADTNWFDWIQNPMVTQNTHHLSISQGTRRGNMRASAERQTPDRARAERRLSYRQYRTSKHLGRSTAIQPDLPDPQEPRNRHVGCGQECCRTDHPPRRSPRKQDQHRIHQSERYRKTDL